jgi:hypothetical protein
MNKTSVEYGLQGAFKMDTYDAEGNFVETTDWFSNFITQTGLVYPTIYSFANCFRFLTIGKDAGNNYGGLGAAVPTVDGNGNVHQRNPTTGCFDPIFTFTASNGETQRGTSMGWEGYETGTDPLINSSCRTVVSPNGIRFYRAWQVPSGDVGVTMNNTGGFLNIQELSVSPSSGQDPIGCFAFSRVARNLPLKNGYRAVISYQLQVNCSNYTLSSFTGGSFNTGLADISNDPDMLKQWAGLSGLYRQVWAGLSCVDSYGVTFIPKYGQGMEPSITDLSRYYMYLSPDNSQFDINNTGGGPISLASSAWASDGVMKPITQDLSLTAERTSLGGNINAIQTLFYGAEQRNATVPTNSTPFNIRLGGSSAVLKAANLADYSLAPTYVNSTFNYQGVNESGPNIVSARSETISYATPGGSGMSIGVRANDTQEKAVFSTRMFRMPIDTSTAGTVGNQITGRKKTLSRKALFTPASSRGYNSRFGSMVFAYLSNDDTLGDYTYYPLMDSLFYDTSGQAQLQHYRLVSGIYLTERGTGIAGCTVTIRPVGANVQRHTSRRTFQGPVTGYIQVPGWVTASSGTWRLGNMISGVANTGWLGTGTSGNSSWFTGAAPTSPTGCSGWGAVIGFLGDDYNNPSDPAYHYFDMGIAEHPSGRIVEPTGGNPSLLYWPYVRTSQAMYVDFHSILFFSGYGNLFPDTLGTTTAQLAASGFCRPTGYIYHFDAIGGEGNRLLPNFGIGTTDPSDAASLYYDTVNNTTKIGGSLPGLSLDNGLEVYMEIGWNSDCRGCVAGSCLDPTTMAPNP